MGIEGFDNDRWLNNEVNKSLADNGRIDKDEAKAMLDIIDNYGIEKIKINKENLQKLSKALGYKFYNFNIITPGLIRRLKEKANIHNTTKNNISHLKSETKENYSSIYNLKRLKESIKNGEARIGKYKLRLQTLRKYKKQGIKEIKIFYSKKRVRYDTVSIDDAINLYKEMLKAGEISVKVTQAGVNEAKNGKFNNKAAAKEARRQYRRLSSKERHGLPSIFSYARGFEHFSKYNDKQRNKLNKLTGLNILETAWCGGFVAGVMKHEKISLRNVVNKNVAGHYLGIKKGGYHVGIADGKGNYISGNVHGEVVIKPLTNYVGWILPKDAGIKSKVHWRYEGINPPAGAIVIPYARKSSLKAEAENYAHYGTAHPRKNSKYRRKTKSYRNKETTNYQTAYSSPTKHNKHKDPLSVLRTRH